MKRTMILLVVMVLALGVVNAFAFNYGTVQDDNNGAIGQILVNTGGDSGSTDIGHWTDPSFLKGATGAQGIQGIAGTNGLNGIDGQNGMNGLNGNDGINGMNGIDGQNGIDGEKGDIGNDGYTPIKGVDYFDGLNGLDGLQGIQGIAGKDVDPTIVNNLQNTDSKLQNNINNTNSRIDNTNNRVDKLEQMQINVRTELKFIRERHLEVGLYSVYSTTRSVMSEVGLNIVIPIGESYQDREAKKVNARLNRLEKQMGNSAVIEKTLDSRGNIKSISISSGKVAFGGEF
jgi:hypothetical protein